MNGLRKIIAKLTGRKTRPLPGHVLAPLTEAQIIQYASIMSQDGR